MSEPTRAAGLAALQPHALALAAATRRSSQAVVTALQALSTTGVTGAQGGR